MGNMVEDWFNGLPKFTKYMFLATVMCNVAIDLLHLCSPMTFFFHAELLFRHFQIWRLVTHIFYLGRFGMTWPFYCYMFVKYSQTLEETWFGGRPADYMYLLILGGIMMNILAFCLQLAITSHTFIFMLVYIFCRTHPEMVIPMSFGIKVKAIYMPWAWLGLHLVMGHSIFLDLLGILVGHIYFVLTFHYGYLKTPNFLLSYFPDTVNPEMTRGVPPPHLRPGNPYASTAANNNTSGQSSSSSASLNSSSPSLWSRISSSGSSSGGGGGRSGHSWGSGRVLGSGAAAAST